MEPPRVLFSPYILIRSLLASSPALLASMLGCCSGTVPVSKLQPPYRVLVHEAGIGNVAERLVAPGSPEERHLTSWLQAHPSGWSLDLKSYAPSLYIRGEGFTLNLTKKNGVLNYRASPKDENFIQVSRPIEEHDEIRAVLAKGD
jgi:hypothetical protein